MDFTFDAWSVGPNINLEGLVCEHCGKLEGQKNWYMKLIYQCCASQGLWEWSAVLPIDNCKIYDFCLKFKTKKPYSALEQVVDPSMNEFNPMDASSNQFH